MRMIKKNFIIEIYDSIKLYWGIKQIIVRVIDIFDKVLIYPVYCFLYYYLKRRILYHYGADYRWGNQKSQNIDKETGNMGYGLIHYAIIRNLKPGRILCIGSMYGFIPFMMAFACRENRKGHVDFVDAGYDMNDKNDSVRHYFGQGFWKKINPRNHFNYPFENNYLSSYIMTTEEFVKLKKNRYDYIYFDGDHSYTGAVKDFIAFWPRLKTGGFVCFHDIQFNKIKKGIPFEFWKIWKDLEIFPYKIELLNNYSGLGFLQKKGKMDPSKIFEST